MMFKRRRGAEDTPAEQDEALGDEPAGGDEAAVDSVAEEVVPGDPPRSREDGPFDIGEIDEPDAPAAERIDLGAIQVPLVDGLEIRVEMDQESGQPVAVTLVSGDGAVQVRAFSAPRSGGTWAEARTEIRRSIVDGGGTIDESDGPFGPELSATVTAVDERGGNVMQPVRFVGVDGPRWMLQGILLGEGTVRERAGHLEELFRSLVVVRGDQAMPPGNVLAITLPEQVPGDAAVESDDDG